MKTLANLVAAVELDSAAKSAGFNDEAIDALNYVLHVGDWFFEATKSC